MKLKKQIDMLHWGNRSNRNWRDRSYRNRHDIYTSDIDVQLWK